jgi:hypothetical protein
MIPRKLGMTRQEGGLKAGGADVYQQVHVDALGGKLIQRAAGGVGVISDEDVYVAERRLRGGYDTLWRLGVEQIGLDVLGTHAMTAKLFEERRYAGGVDTPLLLGIIGRKGVEHEAGTEGGKVLGGGKADAAAPADAGYEGNPVGEGTLVHRAYCELLLRL